MWPAHWPRIAVDTAEATVAAVDAARTADAAAFGDALDVLADVPHEQVVAVHSGIVRELLETRYADGLATDDVRALLEACVRAAHWSVDASPHALAAVLTGALGVAEPDPSDAAVLAPRAVTAAAVLVVVELSGGRDVREPLVRALGEIARAETVEMP
ncbi:hypothetical protein [Rhodococcus sp. HNM0569]|uniref:hypothetical protein n=1 Tax=Rhodococcus sp. HNM0569 TaxID=2716340 RepID=UPI00146B96D4|nr:hypothetical protein [Rhodococcus sp. HNM0569]NLU84639.1 hypothetical protein [Rhodococcus sp. HNM0569]